MNATRSNRTQDSTASHLAARHHRPSTPKRGLDPEWKARYAGPNGSQSTPKKPKKVGGSFSFVQFIAAYIFSARVLKLGAISCAAFVLLAAVIVGYQSFFGSDLFTVRQVDVQGAVRSPREELMSTLNAYQSKSLWRIDLAALRAQLERYPWVSEAEVVRVLPDTLRVRIREREPIAMARLGSGSLVWIDQDGRVLGERLGVKPGAIPPILSGLDEESSELAGETNRRRVTAYRQVLADLDQADPHFSGSVDEINLKDLQAVRLHLPERRVSVIVGDQDFRERLKTALQVLDAVNHKDISALGLLNISDADRLINGTHRISYLNVTQPKRVIVGLE